MKKTALYKIHRDLGAKIVSFAGYEMPVEYTGVTREHIAVRESIGIFDISHMGDFWVKGTEAEKLLQHITTNDVSKLIPGKAQYTCMPNGKGGIIDDLIIYQYEEDKYFLVVNASNIDKDWNWINQHNTFDAVLENASDNMSQIAVQGPNAIAALQNLTNIKLNEISPFNFRVGKIAGLENIIISATGYTGAGGFELYFYNSQAEAAWNAIMEAGKEFDIVPVGLAARDTLRLEMGYCLYGNDIDDNTSPIEAGLGWITKFIDGNEYIDKEFLYKQKETGVVKKLIGFTMIDRGIPRQHYEIKNNIGAVIGEVTSGTMSPMMKKGIGMGYVKTEYATPGTQIFLQIRNKILKAEVVKFPIYRGG